ncbi:MAG TPA: SRPBCC family protein [Cyanobacteria bacterium UBA8803]|nr:SRPBCC family protein [Cyanobacteria bacterium UBA9273]HBL60667.1 SRPBCC family protein [Cyanobacteria bacterium UBA8803]
MNLKTQVQIIIKAAPEKVFDCAIDCQNLPKFFIGYKSIPAIVSARTTDGLTLRQGSTRIVKNSDGSEIEEAIVTLKRPHIQEYQLIKGFKPPFTWLVRSASGKWLYEAIDSGTRITWHFNFEMRNMLAFLIFRTVLKPPFQEAQKICLENIKKFIETAAGRSSEFE